MAEKKKWGLNRIVCPGLELPDFFRLAAALGCPRVELRNDLPGRGIIDNLEPAGVRELAAKLNMEIIAVNALQKFNLAPLLPRLLEELDSLIALCTGIGCAGIVLCPNNDGADNRDARQSYADTVAALKAFAPRLADSGLTGYIEPLGFPESSLCSLLTAMEAIQDAGCFNYKTLHDTFHHHIGPDSPEMLENSYDIAFTGLVHVSGVEEDIPAEKFRDRHRVLPGPGDRSRSRRQLELLAGLGYSGPVSLEPFAAAVQDLKPAALKAALAAAFEYLG